LIIGHAHGVTRDSVASDDLVTFVTKVLEAVGVPARHAGLTAEDLVAADIEGVPSHGVMLLPLYVERIKAGSVSAEGTGVVVSDRGSAIVIDAENSLGQVVAHKAVDLVSSRAKSSGLAAVAIRNAFHFGAAGRYAKMIADQGAVGIVMSNTRPLMPAPGGAEAMVGNNPIAIAMPTSGSHPAEVDMALSASAMGRIRLAAADGHAIPAGWALDKEGNATTDAAAAIGGMLLPAAGPKGFGLAFMIDLLCGGLSNGAIGAGVRPLYSGVTEPYACAQFFLAIDVGHFVDPQTFADQVRDQAARVSASKPAPGTNRVFAPGELAAVVRAASGGLCTLDSQTKKRLVALATTLGIDASILKS
jgi:LDH2 family malate/lactate/ureidoglycolate dehydrogenase